MNLWYYTIQRLLLLIPIVWGVVTITFVISHILPANPVALLAGPQANEEVMLALTRHLGLDKPLLDQYLLYLGYLFSGDLGSSFRTGRPVLADLKTYFPATCELVFLSLLTSIVVSIPLGTASAIYRDKLLDYILRGITLLGVSMPAFWLGLLFLYLFFFHLGIAPPPVGRIAMTIRSPSKMTGLLLVDTLLQGNLAAFRSALEHLLLPVFTLAFVTMAPLARIVRSAMIDVLQADYIRSARARGIPEFVIYFRHALKNALFPIITIIGALFGNLLSGAVLVETVFAWPGLGRYAVDSIHSLDYAAVQGFVLLSATIYVIVFLLVDLLYFVIDPRMRSDE
ncbi:MAG: ABC transporter permease [Candidatus Tectomicrobia bacterium]|nr:ABC transporter permease [Candidatus Tectomicrobia bacterium]